MNTAFADILERVEPEKFKKEREKEQQQAIVAKSRAGDGWPPRPTIQLRKDEVENLEKSVKLLRNFPQRCVMLKKTFIEFDDKHTQHLSEEAFFNCLTMCNLAIPHPGSRAAIIKKYTDHDDTLEPGSRLRYLHFADDVILPEWPEAVDSRYDGQNWRVVELRNRVAHRRAHTLQKAGRDAIINKKNFDHRIKESRKVHGEALLEVVDRELKQRELLQQANQQWQMESSMKYLQQRVLTRGRDLFDKGRALDQMEEKLHRLHHIAQPQGRKIENHPNPLFKNMDDEIDHELNEEDSYSRNKFNTKAYDFINKKQAELARKANKAFIEQGSKAAQAAREKLGGSASAPSGIVKRDQTVRVGAMVPRNPIDFEVTEVTPTSITFRWAPPIITGGDIISNYEINYSTRITSGNGKRKVYTYEEQPPFRTTSMIHRRAVHCNGATLSGLQAGVEYGRISVRCMNGVGWSEPSSVIEAVQMPPVQPPSVPLLLTFEGDVTAYSFSLKWNEPICNGGIEVTHYEITYFVKEEHEAGNLNGKGVFQWRDVRKTVILSHNKQSWVQRKSIGNLLGGTRYWGISVLAINNEGFRSENSNSVECVTAEPTRIQLLQNELMRARNHKAEYIDMHPKVFLVSQRMVRDEYIKQIIRLIDAELSKEEGTGLQALLAVHKQTGRGEEGEGGGEAAALESGAESAVASAAGSGGAGQPAGEEGGGGGGGGGGGAVDTEVVLDHSRDHVSYRQKKKEEREKNYQFRHMQYDYRMYMISKDIQKHKQEKAASMMKQHNLVHKMQVNQKRIVEVEAELDRVSRFRGDFVNSAVVHGKDQRFPKAALRDQLQLELNKSKGFIGKAKQLVIDGRYRRQAIDERIEYLKQHLQERRAAKQLFVVSANKEEKKQDALRNWGNRPLILTFGAWCEYVQIRQDERYLVQKVWGRLANSEVAACWNKWKAVHRGVLDLEAETQKDTIVSKGGKALLHAGEKRDQLRAGLEDVLGNIANLKGLMKLSDYSFRQREQMSSNVGFEQTQMGLVDVGSDQVEGKDGQKFVLLNQGDSKFKDRDYEEAQALYTAHIENMKAGGDIQGMGRGYERLGEVDFEMNLPSKAVINFDRALQLSKETGIKEDQARAVVGLGRCYEALATYQQAVIQFNRALGLYQGLDDELGMARCYRGLELACGHMHDDNRRRRYKERADAIEHDMATKMTRGLQSLEEMKHSLVGATAEQSACIKLERIAPLVPRLRQIVGEMGENLEELEANLTTYVYEEGKLQRRVDALVAELKKAKETQEETMKSALVHASANADYADSAIAQEFQVVELREMLRRALATDDEKLTEAKKRTAHAKVTFSNVKDDVDQVMEELAVEEGVLMKKVNEKKKFRCMALNPSNPMTNDVMGNNTGGVPLMACSIERNAFVYGLEDGKVQTVIIGDKVGQHIGEVEGHTKLITALAFFEERVYTGSADWTIRVWNVGKNTGGADDNEKKGGEGKVDDDYDGSGSVTSYSGSEKEDLEPVNGKAVCCLTLEGHEATITALSVDVFKVVSGAADTKIRIWDKDTGECLKVVHGHIKTVTCMHLLPTKIITGGADGEVMVWNVHGSATSLFQLTRGTKVLCNFGGEGEFYSGKVEVEHANGTFDILYDDGDKEEFVTRAMIKLPPRDKYENPYASVRRGLRLRGHFKFNEKNIRILAYTVTVVQYASTELVTGDSSGMVIIWDVKKGTIMQKFNNHSGPVHSLVFDATRLVTASGDDTIQVTDLASGDVMQTLRGHEDDVIAVQFDTVKVLSASQDGTIRQWVWGGVKKDATSDKYHTLQLPKDSLVKVAKKYKIKIGELLAWNKIRDKQDTYSGMKLIVGKGKAPVMKTEKEKAKEKREAEKKKRDDTKEAALKPTKKKK